MRLRIDGQSGAGPGVDLPPSADPEAVVAVVRGESADAAGPGVDLDLEAPDPGPAHEHVGLIDGSGIRSVRAALAAAARSLGETAPEDEAIAECERRLAELDPPSVDVAPARRRVAEAGETEAQLQERVAELRGRLRALRDAGVDGSESGETTVAAVEDELAAATAELTEVRTERIAAEQALERATERAREARDRRERRLRLEDRLGNLRRRAREHLAGTVHGAFADAVAAVPGEGSAGERPGAFSGDPTTAALAVARVAEVRAPVVVACGRFPDADAAAGTLGAPVLRIPPR